MPVKGKNGLDAGGKNVTSVASPTADTHAANRIFARDGDVGKPPSYVQSGKLNQYDAARHVYNLKSLNTRRTRSALMRAQGGGRADIVVIGDSTGIGYNGTTTIEANSYPRRMASAIASAIGARVGGTGITPVPAAQGTLGDRWSGASGTVDVNTYPAIMTLYAGSTVTYTSVVRGTTAEIYYSNLSASFTYQIDGGAAVTVPAGSGATTIAKVTATGLSDSVHTIKLNAPNNYAFITAVGVSNTSGVFVHNLSLGGSAAAIGGPSMSWTDYSTATSITGSRLGSLTASGVSPDLVLVCLGGNDIFQGDTPANAIAGLSALRNLYPSADFMMMQGWEVGGTNMAAFNSYYNLKYGLADSLDVPFVDWRDRTGTLAYAIANGWTGTDNIHPSTPASIDLGNLLGSVIATSNLATEPLDPLAAEYDGNTAPNPPATGVTTFSRNKGRRNLAVIDAGGEASEMQTALFSNKIARMNAVNASATPTVDGLAVTFAGTASAASVTSSTFYSGTVRVRATQATATAGLGAGIRTSTAQWFLSSTPNMGGFYAVARVGLFTTTSANRGFVGFSSTTAALSPTVDPSSLLNQVGFGFDAAHTTWRFMCNDGSGTSTMVDLGAAFRTQVAATDMYEFRLFSKSGSGQAVRWSAVRLNDGAYASGVASADLPAVGTLLSYHTHHSNGTVAAVNAIDVQSIYIETDN